MCGINRGRISINQAILEQNYCQRVLGYRPNLRFHPGNLVISVKKPEDKATLEKLGVIVDIKRKET